MTSKEEEILKANRFLEQMLIELNHNHHKGSVLQWNDFDNMISELEYHKAKMFLAIRYKNMSALKEYIADIGNILLAIGNKFELYSDDSKDDGMAYELNKDIEIIRHISISNQSLNQKLINDEMDTN